MTKRWLITRPAHEATHLASLLQARGIDSVLAPVIRIVPLPDVSIDLEGVQALLFTSANGVRTFTRLENMRALPVLAVGEITAEAAREAGFALVESADGNAEALGRLAKDRLDPAAGALLHGAGMHLAGELRAGLETEGFEVRQVALYEAEAVDHLPGPAVEALTDGTLDGVMFFSPRSAEIFGTLAEAAGLTGQLARLTALCLSTEVAARLTQAGGTAAWGGIRTAARPDRASMLALAYDPAAAESPDVEEKTMDPADDPGQSGAQDRAGADGDAGDATAQVVQLFGGIRPMAHKLEAPVTTVQGWKRRGHIPEARHREIAEAAERHHIDLPSLLLAATRPPAGSDVAETPETAGPAEPPAAESEAAATADTQMDAVTAQADPSDGARVEPVMTQSTEASEEAAYAQHPEAARGGGRGIALLALLVALVAVAAATAPWWIPQQVAELSGQPSAVALDQRIAAIEQTTQETPEGEPLSDRIGALEENLEGIASSLEVQESDAGSSAERMQALEDRLDAIESVASDESAPAIAATLTALEARVAVLEQSEDAGGTEDIAGAVSALAERIAALESGMDAFAATDDLAPLGEALADTGEQLVAQAARLAAVERSSVRVDGLEGEAASLAERVDTLEALEPMKGGEVESRLAALEAVDPADEAVLTARDQALADEIESLSGELAGITALLAGLEAVETRMQAMETAQTANAVLRQSVIDLLDRVQRADTGLRALHERLDAELVGTTSALERQIVSVQLEVATALTSLQNSTATFAADVEAELTSMQATIGQLVAAGTTTQALLLAVGQLRDTMERGQEYAAALSTVQTLAANDPEFTAELALLEEHAGVGIPTRRQLEAEFLPMAEEVRRADAVPPDADWLERAGASIEGLVSVRPVAGEVSGDSVSAVLARAEGRLGRGDLAGTIDAMRALDGPPADAASQWLASAMARVAAETALQTLTDRAVSRLTGVEPILPSAEQGPATREQTSAPETEQSSAPRAVGDTEAAGHEAETSETEEAATEVSEPESAGETEDGEAGTAADLPESSGIEPEGGQPEDAQSPEAADAETEDPGPATEGDAAAETPPADEAPADDGTGADGDAAAPDGDAPDGDAEDGDADDRDPAADDSEQPGEPATEDAGDPS